MVLVRGIYHPPPTRDTSFKGNGFHEDEVEDVEFEYLGRPVFVEHNPEIVVGEVRAFSRGPNGHMICDMFIDASKPFGRMVMKDISEKRMNSLSIGFKARMSKKGEFTSIECEEISIVEVGRLPDTYILAYGDSKGLVYKENAIATLLQKRISVHNSQRRDPKMATTASEQADFGAAQAAANAVDLAALMRENEQNKAELALLKKTEAEKRATGISKQLFDKETGIFPLNEEMKMIKPDDLGSVQEAFIEVGKTDPGATLISVTNSLFNQSRVVKNNYMAQLTEKTTELEEMKKLLASKDEELVSLKNSARSQADPLGSVEERRVKRSNPYEGAPAETAASKQTLISGYDVYKEILNKGQQMYATVKNSANGGITVSGPGAYKLSMEDEIRAREDMRNLSHQASQKPYWVGHADHAERKQTNN